MRLHRLRTTLVISLLLLLHLVEAAPAQEAPGAMRSAPADEGVAVSRGVPEPSVVPEVLRLLPAELDAASELDALRSQPVMPGVPYRNGFLRSGPAHRVEINPRDWQRTVLETGELKPSSDSTVSWYGRFVVEDAYAFRILLRDLRLPEGARIWIDAGEVHLGPYGKELLDPAGDLWLPPVPGPEAVVEIELAVRGPRSRAPLGFTTGQVMQLVAAPGETEAEPQVWTDCDVDAMCIDTATLVTIDQLREATARLSFVEGAFSYLCSGGLLNDTDTSGFRPFLLTANHCFDSQASASSLVAYFDYYTDSCNGTAPSLWSVPSVSGSTLLATNPSSDFTFVELSANPGGYTWYLGWTTATPGSGSSMHRVSHPEGTTQKYSASAYTGSAGIVCGGLPTSNFHYSATTVGSTAGGSSGAPVTQTVAGDARVVGQLLGVCHYTVWDDCSYSTYNDVDGAFSVTFPSISQWLDPSTPCADGFEPDDSAGLASTIVSAAPQTHSICPVGDEDWVTFTLGDESAVRIETSGPSGDTRMWLYDAALSQVEYDDDGGTALFSLIERSCGVDALPAGTYYVKIDEYLDNNVIDSYDLTYTRLESCGGSCPADLTLSNTTLSGTQSFRADVSITLGPSLVIQGTSIDVLAGERVVITSGTQIGGSFSAGTDPAACQQ